MSRTDLSFLVSGPGWVTPADLSGCTQARISNSMDTLCWSWEASFDTYVRPAGGLDPSHVVPFDSVELRFDGQPFLKGFVDEIEDSYDANNANVAMRGRSVTADLVDCSAITKKWRNAAVVSVISDLLAPFDLQAQFTFPCDQSVRAFSTQEGETVLETLRRLCDSYGFLPQSKADGKVLFTRAGQGRIGTELVYGQNIVSGGRLRAGQDRFSEYIFKSQTAGDDDWYGTSAAHARTSISDQEVSRFRPLTILAEAQRSTEELKKRAVWERNNRAARSVRLSYRIDGWSYGSDYWAVNNLVMVTDSRFGITMEWKLISAVTFSQDGEDQYTELELYPESYCSVSEDARVVW